MPREFTLHVNGRDRQVTADEDRPLLEILREDLALTGAKYGCGEGECGACTVLLDGVAIRSCMTTVAEVGASKVRTIEDLAAAGALTAVQQAFIDCHAMQCGYCVPGQILTATALLAKAKQPSRDEIIAAMNGNLCRCCNYSNILAAVEKAAAATN